jgi:hypothetical protein
LPDFAFGMLPSVREAASIGLAQYATYPLEVVTMKVFTSVFVAENLRTTFDEMEEAARAEMQSLPTDGQETSRRRVVDMHVRVELERDRTDGMA